LTDLQKLSCLCHLKRIVCDFYPHFLLVTPMFCFSFRYDRLLETCSIALVGKYTKFSDSYASVIKALEHSALAINHKLDIKVCISPSQIHLHRHPSS